MNRMVEATDSYRLAGFPHGPVASACLTSGECEDKMEIVFQEKELEDFLCRDGNLEEYLGLRFVARQVKTPNGIVDILAYNPDTKSFVIIELKRDQIDLAALVQITRYRHYFQSQRQPKHGMRGRNFQCLLIGKSLHSDLNFIVEYWESEHDYGRIFYRLYGIKFDQPLSFCWHSLNQRAIESGDHYSKAGKTIQ